MLSYGVDANEVQRPMAAQIDAILRGARPETLPIYQMTKLHLVINLKTARALGVEIPPDDPCPCRRGDRIGNGVNWSRCELLASGHARSLSGTLRSGPRHVLMVPVQISRPRWEAGGRRMHGLRKSAWGSMLLKASCNLFFDNANMPDAVAAQVAPYDLLTPLVAQASFSTSVTPGHSARPFQGQLNLWLWKFGPRLPR